MSHVIRLSSARMDAACGNGTYHPCAGLKLERGVWSPIDFDTLTSEQRGYVEAAGGHLQVHPSDLALLAAAGYSMNAAGRLVPL